MHSSVSLFNIMSYVHNPCVFYEVAIRLEQGFLTWGSRPRGGRLPYYLAIARAFDKNIHKYF